MIVSSRYRFSLSEEEDFLDSPQCATKDMALVEVMTLAKRQGRDITLWDTHDSPHRCVGKATKDEWLPPVAICKVCKGKRILPKVYQECTDCDGLGVIIQKPRWRPG